MFVDYKIDVAQAKATLPEYSRQLGPFADVHLQELTAKLEELTEDVRITAEDLIRVVTISALLCTQLAEQALYYVQEDGELPKFGG